MMVILGWRASYEWRADLFKLSLGWADGGAPRLFYSMLLRRVDPGMRIGQMLSWF